ncbi:hypothetical protein SAMN02910447_02796 [Ruminococcus sp. YE71]|uniref:hypothetical protein n=1 Tax=unclassified Ruminococcus TaxID=2608920 RepID=UPI00088BD8D9|nr:MULTISPECIES: hypothetical protein [unclassified Ruminococcus]SDA27226.1 hypothetical protein SAMN02910446_02756 [Ruminococcus sp. YE78]SFW45375.1 hypothetical protein SAMN02910447_02796 [Ruminococcus sp. YE71]
MYSSHLSGRRDMPLAYLNAVCSGRVREEALSQLTAVQREQLAERLGSGRIGDGAGCEYFTVFCRKGVNHERELTNL